MSENSERPSLRPRILAVLAAVAATLILVATTLSVYVAQEINSRTEDRLRADEVSVADRAETRRIVDDLLCELAALRDAAEARDPTFAQNVPGTIPRRDYLSAPCPPPRSAP